MTNLQREFVYLACPYTDPEDDVQYRRFLKATEVAAVLLHRGFMVFSPLTHGRPMEVHSGLPASYSFWQRLDRTYIRHSQCVFVLPLHGWHKSMGVLDEIGYARDQGIPVMYLDAMTCDVDYSFDEDHDPGWAWCDDCETFHPATHEHSLALAECEAFETVTEEKA